MAQLPVSSDNMSDFPGLYSNADSRNLPAGAAADQVNLQCLRIGELTVRRGYQVVTFED